MSKLRAILIDDETDCLRLLALQLEQFCQNVQVVGEFSDSTEGLIGILSFRPDIVFLDIEMPGLNGFSLLEKLGEISFHLIFVTAYNEFALKAFRFSALDYLLKPLDSSELQEAVNKAEKRQATDNRQIELLRMQWQSGISPQKIAVPGTGGVTFVELKELVVCEADNNYTKLVLTTGKNLLLSKTLRDVQEVLEEKNFLRVHRQFLINLDHIKSYHKGDNAYVVMTGDITIPVAKNQKERLVQRFGWL